MPVNEEYPGLEQSFAQIMHIVDIKFDIFSIWIAVVTPEIERATFYIPRDYPPSLRAANDIDQPKTIAWLEKISTNQCT